MARPDDEQVFRNDGFKCVYCDFDGSSFEAWVFLVVDHFKPRSKGGSNQLENLKTACVSCNTMKGDYDWPSVEVARENLGRWRALMREFWEAKVRPLVPSAT